MEYYSICICFLLGLPSCFAQVSESECKHGQFIRHLEDCRRWFQCVWGKPIEMTPCSDGTVFSMRFKTCVRVGDPGDDCGSHVISSSTTEATPESCFQRSCHICHGGTLTLDLDAGRTQTTGSIPPGVTILQKPSTGYADIPCGKLALLKVKFKYPNATECLNLLKIELTFGLSRKTRMFNFGDSRTNNGQGGDGFTQENDAEIDNFGNSGSGDVTIEGSDKCNRNELNVHPNAVGPNVTKATFLIGNQYYRITNNAGLDKELCHNKCLFALAGQLDSEGLVNEEIFLAFNRVVNGNYYRIGYGTCTAKISWECPKSVISADSSN